MANIAPAPVGTPEPASSDQLVEFGVEAASQSRRVLRRFLRHKLAVASSIILLILVLASFFGGSIARYSYLDQSRTALSSPPSLDHWFGTDTIGHDTFAQVLRGARRSLMVAFLVAALSTTFGALVGALAGYYRGWIETLLMRLTDLFLTIPTIAVLLLVASRYRDDNGNWLALSFVIAGLAWMPLARVVRGIFLSLREREFVEAARALGATDRRIIVRHLVPNSLGPIIVNATLLIGVAIITETALSFLGFGIAKPDTSLGRLVAEGAVASRTRWWLFYLPGLYLVLISLCINFVGDGLRDAIDPQQKRIRA
ncbi:MAG TPA: ABC transporter permease [Acidimicrobiales bacterium]|nr:ABC transporter permease [Acidimicrobiales bacterium]